MSYENYTLEIVSHLPEFAGRKLKKYGVDGIDTVGAWGNEPFEIVFKNNTYQKVQVKLSIDGTDILTGKLADTEINNDMWVVHGYGTLNLKAWPETSKGGAQFIFTSGDKGVAVHTHGDLSNRGIIAAAVYTETYVPPYTTPTWIKIGGCFGDGATGVRLNCNDISDDSLSFNSTLDSQTFGSVVTNDAVSASYYSSNDSRGLDNTRCKSSNDLKSLASVGAGKHVNQNITYTSGLIQPGLNSIIRVRYLWWDELVARCRSAGVQPPLVTGFPGDGKRMMSIGNTPRQDNWSPPPFTVPSYTRF